MSMGFFLRSAMTGDLVKNGSTRKYTLLTAVSKIGHGLDVSLVLVPCTAHHGIDNGRTVGT